MSVASAVATPEAPIVEQIARARAARRRYYLILFASTWIVIVGAIVGVIIATGNAKAGFVANWGWFIVGGVGITIFVCVVSIILAVVLALVGALGRLSANPVLNGVASLYVSLVRGTPLLVQLYFIYYGLPALGIVLAAIPAGIFGLGFNYGAYMTEIFRAGIQAVPKGQREAAQALGMPHGLVMRRIVLPQAIRIVIPAIGNDFVSMIKDSSLVSIFGVQEVLWRSQTSGRPANAQLTALIFAALVYWILTIVFSYAQSRLEARMARSDR